MFENFISRVNELKEDYFKNVVEEKVSSDKKSSIFNEKYGQGNKEYNPGSISGILKDNSETEERKNEIKQQINEAKQKKSDNEQKIRTKESSIRETEGSINSTKSEIGSLKSELASLHEPQQSEYMKTTINEYGEEIQEPDTAAYEAAYNAYIRQKEALERQIEQKEQELEQLETKLDNEKSELETLKSELTQNESEITNLEAELRTVEQQAAVEDTPEKQEEERVKEEKKQEEKEEVARQEKETSIVNALNDISQKIQSEMSALGINEKLNIFSAQNISQNLNKLEGKAGKAAEIEKNINSKKAQGKEDTQANSPKSLDEKKMNTVKSGKVSTEEAKQLFVSRYGRIAPGLVSKFDTTLKNADKDGDGQIDEHVVNKIFDRLDETDTIEEAEVIVDDFNTIIENCLDEEETEEIIANIHNKRDLTRAANLARNGIPTSSIINVLNNPSLNVDQVIQLAEIGVTSREVDALTENRICAQNLSSAIQLAQLGRSTSEIIEILNNSNCRKGIKQVIKIAEKGISTSEIIKTFNNPNTLMNLDKTVELASNGKTADEINDIYNDANSIGNLDAAIDLAKMNISSKNIIGMLNDKNVKKLLTGADDLDNIENNIKAQGKENINPEENEDNSSQYNMFKEIVANMEFNNVQEKDIFNILSRINPLNANNNSSINLGNNLNILKTELIKKRTRK